MCSKRIAIIGGGPAGVSLCIQLEKALSVLSSTTPPVDILLFEQNSSLGHGLPYALTEKAFCINLPKQFMTLVPGEEAHFAAWLAQQADGHNEEFPPRYSFGQFAQERLARHTTHPNIQIKPFTHHEVRDITVNQNNTYQIHTIAQAQDLFFTADYVVLALGHIPPNAAPELQEKLSNPWNPTHYLINARASVGIIGTRLSAIDVALKLQQQNHQGVIVMMSRSGLLSSVRGSPKQPKLIYLTPSNIKNLLAANKDNTLLVKLIVLLERELKPYLPSHHSLLAYLEQIKATQPLDKLRKELLAARAENTPWQPILSCFYQILYALWPLLSEEEQRLFLTTYSSYLFTFLCSYPYEKALTLYAMMKRKQLSVHGGLISVQQRKSYYEALFNNGKTLKIDYLFQATGAGTDVERIPLLANLVHKGYIAKHPLGGIRVNHQTYRTINQNQHNNPNLYALGDIVKGACFKTIELGQIVTQAARITEELIQQIRQCVR